jgi:hypothetical protein
MTTTAMRMMTAVAVDADDFYSEDELSDEDDSSGDDDDSSDDDEDDVGDIINAYDSDEDELMLHIVGTKDPNDYTK